MIKTLHCPLEGYLLFLYYLSGKLIEKQRVASVVLVVLVMVLVVLGVVLIIIIEVVASHYCYYYLNK